MKKYYIWLIVFIFSIACTSQKKTTHADLMKNAPSWVQQTPNTSMYYHGVGMALKTSQHDFRERARQNALSEIASAISVNISTTSVLNQFEFDNNYTEFFRDNIKLSAQHFLQGYELVENWENDRQYWVYYRLSKTRYEQIKQERLHASLNQSLSKFHQARSLSLQGRVNDALGFYIRSVEDIREFLADELKAEIDGENKIYSTALMSALMDQLEALQFDFQVDILNLKPGPSSVITPLQVILKDQQGRPISGVPVIIRYSWLPGAASETITDARGAFRIMPMGIFPGRRSELISCNVDMKKISASNTQDVMVQQLFSSLNASTYSLPVEIVPPVCFINLSMDNDYNLTSIREEISRLLILDGFDPANSEAEADYILDSEIRLAQLSAAGNRFTTNVRASFVLRDKNRSLQYGSKADTVTGIGLSESEAWEDALKSLTGNIRISLFPALINEAFRKN
jgi:hypothetical protein